MVSGAKLSVHRIAPQAVRFSKQRGGMANYCSKEDRVHQDDATLEIRTYLMYVGGFRSDLPTDSGTMLALSLCFQPQYLVR